jgi:4-diphosphocytidyl-2-C-methyl-D-erythritol kinase
MTGIRDRGTGSGAGSATVIAEKARAKVNLALHVTGRRADGYHLLDSLVCFPEIGDHLSASLSTGLSLVIEGAGARGVPQDEDNLVLRAARLVRPSGRGAAIRLTKVLPVAAGIGGGSADAAATLRLLARLWSLPVPDPATALALGADIPVCLASRPMRMRGIGEALDPVRLPPFALLLVNPGHPVPTAAAFARLGRRDNPPLPEPPRRFADLAALVAYLAQTRNDLEAPARALAPVIGEALAAIRGRPGCALARMSGSGATTFGLFATLAEAERAAADLARARPDWWLAATPVGT